MKSYLILISLLFSGKAFSQFPNVLISSLREPEEVSIAINPKNTNEIVAGSNLANRYWSNDAGQTWHEDTLICTAYNVYGDPVVIWDTANVCYYLHLSDPTPSITTGGSWIDRIVIQRSTDKGKNYTTCTAVGKNGTKAQDKAWPVVNPYNNEIHITWTQFDVYGSPASPDSSIILHAKSTDQGLTWSTPKRISHYAGNCMDSDKTVEGAVPAIGPAGEVYVSWAGPKGLVFQKSLDGGTTWMTKETVVDTFPYGWDYNITGLIRANGLPFTSCDLSNSPYKGTIYVNWSDIRNGSFDGDIWLKKSTDGGLTWSNKIRVNNDVAGKQQFMSSMTVDQATGYVYILFYDRRNFSGGTNTDVYMAMSTDGGSTFANYKINANTFAPTTANFFGDYIHISAHNNIVRPIWTQMTAGNLSIYTALIDPLTVGIYNSRVPDLEILMAKPNPFKNETSVEFNLKRELTLDIQLVNNDGKILQSLSTLKRYSAGNHSLVINAQQLSLAKGIYYLVFYGDEKSKFLKLIVE